MAPHETPAVTGLIVEEELELTLDELCGICAVEHRHIIELVDEGIIDTRSTTELRFSGGAVRRARTALRLQRDLGLNTAGTALALDLMDRIEMLERRLRSA